MMAAASRIAEFHYGALIENAKANIMHTGF
jgi:hypothetical protein